MTPLLAAITDLYREILPEGGSILDVMSGWVSHLPPEIPYSRVVGIGANACELAENPFLDEWRVQDLNCDPRLPFAGGEFDGATLCVAVHQLIAAARRHPRSRTSAEAGGAAGRHILQALPAYSADRLLVPARRHRPFVPGRPSFCRGRQLGRCSLPRSNPAGRRRPALRRYRPQPWGKPSWQRRLTRPNNQVS